jgi:shikimate kinase
LPLKLDAINHLKKDGHVIYIDVAIETILNRLELMKVDRIV